MDTTELPATVRKSRSTSTNAQRSGCPALLRHNPAAAPRPPLSPRGLLTPVSTRQAGTMSAEFALLVTAFVTVILAISSFGATLSNYVQLSYAVTMGARVLSISRTATNPRTSTVDAIKAAAATLNSTMLSANIVTTINGAVCASDSACQTALKNGPGTSATVTASYPCSLGPVKLTCNLVSQSTTAVQ